MLLYDDYLRVQKNQTLRGRDEDDAHQYQENCLPTTNRKIIRT